MAVRKGKSPSRLELRAAGEAAERKSKEAGGETKAKAKSATKAPRKKATKKKKAESARVKLVWGVFDNSNQQVATFAHNDRESAVQKAADMTAKGRGAYFVQPGKEAMAAAELEEKTKEGE